MADKWAYIGSIGVALAIALGYAADSWRDVECARAGLEQRTSPSGVIWVKPEVPKVEQKAEKP